MTESAAWAGSPFTPALEGRHYADIFRTVPTTQPYNNKFNRIYRLSHVTVTSPDGAPTQTEVTEGDETRIKIGIPGAPSPARVLDYDVAGAISSFAGHQELYWVAFGQDSQAPYAGLTDVVGIPAGSIPAKPSRRGERDRPARIGLPYVR